MDARGPRDPAVRGRRFLGRPRGGHHANARPRRGARRLVHGHRRLGADQGPLLRVSQADWIRGAPPRDCEPRRWITQDTTERHRQSGLANPCAGRDMVEPPGATGPTGDWEKVYATSDVATLPWYNPDLDTDIERALKAHRLRNARILDLGTGPATQAMNLAKRGFDVLATDISSSAIRKAKAAAKSARLSIELRVDNVIASKLEPNLVDAIMDRGVFHVLPKDKRPIYVQTVHRTLRPSGWIFLKSF